MSAEPPSAERIARGLVGVDALEIARAALAGGQEAWVVGGAPRDAALGIPVADVDLAVAGDAREAARAIAAAADAHPFELSDEFATWRVVDRGGAWTLDVARLRAATIEEDLRLRDFTANAIALPLGGGREIDPTGGLADLRERRLRVVSERSFSDDPLRILRAARIAAALGLEPEPETVELARADARRAGESAGERLFAELAGMVSGPDPLAAVELLERLGGTPAVLPELDALHGVSQSANHHLDAHGHTIEVLRRVLELEGDLEPYAGPVAPRVADLLAQPLADGLTRRDGLRFAALLHDVGKPVTRRELPDGRVSFIGHDATGAEMNRGLCRRLRTSRRFADYLAAITRDHLVLGFMVRERPLPPRRVWEYLRRCGRESVDTTLLTVADRLSAQGGGVPQAAIDGHLELAREMLEAAAEWEREGPAPPLLRGDEIAAEAGIAPGPDLGEAVRELEAAQFAGEVGDREDAIAHLRAWHRGR